MGKVRNEVTPASVNSLAGEVMEYDRSVINKQIKPWSRLAFLCAAGVFMFEWMAPGHGVVELVKQNRMITEARKTAAKEGKVKRGDGTFSETAAPASEEETKESAAFLTVTAKVLKVRSSPNGDVIGKAEKGQSFEYLEVTDDNWYRILYEGREGYVFGEYVSEQSRGDREHGTQQ
ncbi:MAG: SH3 domain-containing protein [Clostridium sp.]|nr:SH3 domain-containing protein [Clostridium sp.]